MRNHTIDPTSVSIPDSHVKITYEEAAKPVTADGEARRGHSAGAAQQQPPLSNTGAEIHGAAIDWLQFTFRTQTQSDRDYLFRKWSAYFGGSVCMERNMFGYDRVHSILGTGFIMWNKARLDMGLHISLPSKALNVFSQFSGSETAIYELLIEARGEVDVRFTRVDVAFDTSKVTMQQVKQSIEGGELITRSREVLLQQSLRGGSGMTIYIGSGASDRRVRIYDKAAERGVDGVWTRIETQYRKKYADQVVDKILLSDVSLEMLAMTSFDFREVGNTRTNNRERSSWWAAILEEFETVVFSIKSAISTLAEKALWLEAAIAPTLAAVYLKFGPEWFERFMNAGVERISPVMQALIYQT